MKLYYILISILINSIINGLPYTQLILFIQNHFLCSPLYSKTCLKRPFKKKTKIGFQDQVSLDAGQKYCRMLQEENSAIHLIFIKLPFVI